MLPAFAIVTDLAARVPGGIAPADVERAQAALDGAAALIRAEAGRDWADDFADLPLRYQDVIEKICVAAALRSFLNPVGATQSTVGDVSLSYANASADVYLTAAERAVIARIVGGGAPGISSIRVVAPAAVTATRWWET
jgi:hypothetical protein